MSHESSFSNALQEWGRILKTDQIVIDGQKLGAYSGSTSGRGTRPSAVLFPASTEDVAVVVKVAGKFKIPLYPISRGKNWGYGDACAPTGGQVILDLGRMNRILEVNSKLGYAVIEPGVTQGQLHEYLNSHQTGLWMDATGAGPDTSLVGNTADRGFGHTRYGDHFQNTCGMEVVLADGRILKTGFGHYEGARSTYTFRYGIGPVLDGLFSQSNCGIITRVGIWLMPVPEDFCAFFFSCPEDRDLKEIIDLLAPLKIQGVLQSAVHVANDLRTISGRIGYPWDLTGGETPLPDHLRHRLRKRFGFGAWNGCGSIAGPKEMVSALKKKLRRSLKAFHPVFLDDRKLKRVETIVNFFPARGPFRTLREKLAIVKPTYEMLKGAPVTEHLKGASWRVRNRDQKDLLNPVAAGAGLIWISPVLPLEGRQAEELMGLMAPVYRKYGFDVLVTFTLLTERSLCCVSNISFDTANAEESKKALECYDEMMILLKSHGFFPYRTGPLGFEKLASHSHTFWDVAGDIKRTLDPLNIIAPGRYQPALFSSESSSAASRGAGRGLQPPFQGALRR